MVKIAPTWRQFRSLIRGKSPYMGTFLFRFAKGEGGRASGEGRVPTLAPSSGAHGYSSKYCIHSKAKHQSNYLIIDFTIDYRSLSMVLQQSVNQKVVVHFQ